jgi:hypothetical protein
MSNETREKAKTSGDEKEGLGWSAGQPMGGSNAGDGVGQGQEGEEYGVYGRGATNGGRYADEGDKVGDSLRGTGRDETEQMADMDTSGLVESQVTRPATITPGARPEEEHNTERGGRPNQRDALSHKLNEEKEED